MKKCLLIVIATILFGAASAFAQQTNNLPGDKCSCTSPNGNCSASASCPHGCYAICTNAGCSAGCQAEFAEIPSDKLQLVLSQASDFDQLTTELSSLSRRKIEFNPTEKTSFTELHIQATELWDALKSLSQNGEVKPR